MSEYGNFLTGRKVKNPRNIFERIFSMTLDDDQKYLRYNSDLDIARYTFSLTPDCLEQIEKYAGYVKLDIKEVALAVLSLLEPKNQKYADFILKDYKGNALEVLWVGLFHIDRFRGPRLLPMVFLYPHFKKNLTKDEYTGILKYRPQGYPSYIYLYVNLINLTVKYLNVGKEKVPIREAKCNNFYMASLVQDSAIQLSKNYRYIL